MNQEMFPKAGRLGRGYRIEQVDHYFATAREIYDEGDLEEMDTEGVRNVTFDLVRGGYQVEAVDEALDRLEAAFLQRRRAEHVSERGTDAWMDQVASTATTLYPRLLRPEGERFAPARGRGYDVSQVDAFMARILAYFDEDKPLTVDEARRVTFRASKGDRAYDESSVDLYLARVVEVLLSVE